MTEIPSDRSLRVEELQARLVPALQPLAPLAYNYRWSWERGGAEVFAALDRARWSGVRENPVALLGGLARARQLEAAGDPALIDRIGRLSAAAGAEPSVPQRPIAFFCAEFGVHGSLPIYSGGLGVLAGDILKEASDQGLPVVAIGLLYRRGYFCQRLDLSGWQQEYWLEHDPAGLALSLVRGDGDAPLSLSAPIFGRPLAFRVWRADIGRVALLLLDADLPENDAVGRWTSARLYDANPQIRLAQYGLLGLGGARALAALGLEPSVFHLNEGHPALAALETAAGLVAAGAGFRDALDALRDRIVFTTHTPLAAGNETYPPELFLQAFAGLSGRLGIDDDELLALARSTDGQPGMSALAMRLAGRRNAVSRLHASTAREIWAPLFPEPGIDHVTNGAHLPTFLSDPMARLFDRHLGEAWRADPADPAAWAGVAEIPNAELWRARCEARSQLVEAARVKGEADRLLRGEDLDYARAAAGLDPDALTLGFARRLAGYKRLDVLFRDPARLGRILTGDRPCQLLLAGKAHPHDDEGKRLLQQVYRCRHEVGAGSGRMVFLEDYDLAAARGLVAGCDVWINLPRPPLEASGTSGMKAAFNGVLQLSVLDGWWAEAFNGRNGWGIEANPDAGPADADAADSARVYRILEEETLPLFYERDDAGVPHRWCELVKESIVTCAPRFTATRMVREYVSRIYP